MMIRSLLAPAGSDRRLAIELGRYFLRHPRSGLRRISASNVATWRRFRRTVITCNLCGHRGTLMHEMYDASILDRMHIGVLRETLRCRHCLARMRDRTMAAAVLDLMATQHGVHVSTIAELGGQMPPGIRVLDTDANGRLAHLLGALPEWLVSLFDPGLEIGSSIREGVINVDLEQMPFDDESFDLILTTEVMEHVRFIDVAHREVARCLKTNGRYVFTVPYDDSLAETWNLVDPQTDEDLVHPPHIHPDAGMREGGIRSYRVFGRDIVADLRKVGLDTRFERMDRAGVGIFDGDVFIAEKV